MKYIFRIKYNQLIINQIIFNYFKIFWKNVPPSNELDSLSGATTYNEYIAKTKNNKFLCIFFLFNLLPTYNTKSYLPFFNLLPILY